MKPSRRRWCARRKKRWRRPTGSVSPPPVPPSLPSFYPFLLSLFPPTLLPSFPPTLLPSLLLSSSSLSLGLFSIRFSMSSLPPSRPPALPPALLGYPVMLKASEGGGGKGI